MGPPDIADARYARVQNIPVTIAAAVASKLATMAELGTVLSLQDLWDLLEVHAVNQHNEAVLSREQRA